MPNTHENLSGLFAAIADAIRTKTGSEDLIIADSFPEAIEAIPKGKPRFGNAPGQISTYEFILQAWKPSVNGR